MCRTCHGERAQSARTLSSANSSASSTDSVLPSSRAPWCRRISGAVSITWLVSSTTSAGIGRLPSLRCRTPPQDSLVDSPKPNGSTHFAGRLDRPARIPSQLPIEPPEESVS